MSFSEKRPRPLWLGALKASLFLFTATAVTACAPWATQRMASAEADGLTGGIGSDREDGIGAGSGSDNLSKERQGK